MVDDASAANMTESEFEQGSIHAVPMIDMQRTSSLQFLSCFFPPSCRMHSNPDPIVPAPTLHSGLLKCERCIQDVVPDYGKNGKQKWFRAPLAKQNAVMQVSTLHTLF